MFVKPIICTIFVPSPSQSIQIAEQNYVIKIAQTLDDPNTSSKCYWSLLKTLLNGKKFPYIPPLFYGVKYIADFQRKTEILNPFLLIEFLRFQTEASCFLNYHIAER